MNRSTMKPWRIVSLLAFLAVGSAHATILLGTTVTGSLTGGSSPNQFDPANLSPPATYVPAGALNTTSPTVVIQDPAVEFGAAGGDPRPGLDFTQFLADFSDSGLSIDFQLHLPSNTTAFSPVVTFQFTDLALAGLSVTKNTDTFVNGGLSSQLVGDTLTLTWGGEFISVSEDARQFENQATFSFAASSVPEPGTLWLIGCAAAMALIKRRRA